MSYNSGPMSDTGVYVLSPLASPPLVTVDELLAAHDPGVAPLARGRSSHAPTAEELAAVQQSAAAHADDPGPGVCRLCGVTRCAIWREADTVILRGLDGMADPAGEQEARA